MRWISASQVIIIYFPFVTRRSASLPGELRKSPHDRAGRAHAAVLRGRIEPEVLQWTAGLARPWFILHARSGSGRRVCVPVLARRRTAV